MLKFSVFMASPAGRLLRIVAGIGLIGWGMSMHSTVGIILAIAGILPLAAGLFDWCVFAPLFGLPFKGCHLRRAASRME